MNHDGAHSDGHNDNLNNHVESGYHRDDQQTARRVTTLRNKDGDLVNERDGDLNRPKKRHRGIDINTQIAQPGTNENDDSTTSFATLQDYRQLEALLTQERAQAARTGDVESAVKELVKADELFGGIRGGRNNDLYAHDARVLAGVSETVELGARALQLGVSLFQVSDALSRCRKFMGNDEIDPNFLMLNWFKMGVLFRAASRKASLPDHLCGPLQTERRVRAPIIRAAADIVGSKQTALAVSSPELLSQEVTTPEYVIERYRVLKRKMGYEKVNLLRFIIDPRSFAKSVENLFYTSFLLKEGRIVLEADENRLPMIRVKGKTENVTQSGGHHLIFQLDMSTWRKLIEKFEITEPFEAT